MTLDAQAVFAEMTGRRALTAAGLAEALGWWRCGSVPRRPDLTRVEAALRDLERGGFVEMRASKSRTAWRVT